MSGTRTSPVLLYVRTVCRCAVQCATGSGRGQGSTRATPRGLASTPQTYGDACRQPKSAKSPEAQISVKARHRSSRPHKCESVRPRRGVTQCTHRNVTTHSHVHTRMLLFSVGYYSVCPHNHPHSDHPSVREPRVVRTLPRSHTHTVTLLHAYRA